jgi:glycosyltransferase involved in cell wall biosynthesis
MSDAGRKTSLDILFLRNLYWPEDFGGNRYPFEVTARLARRGHRVNVVTGKRSREKRPAMNEAVTINYFRVWRGHPLATHVTNAVAVIPRLLACLRRRPDVVLVSSYDVGLPFFTLRRRPPSAFIYHSSLYSDAVERLGRRAGASRILYRLIRAYMRSLERHVLGGADRIVAVSDFSMTEIVRREPATTSRVSVIPTGVDTQFFAPTKHLGAARLHLGLDPEQNVLIVVGRLVPVKRYDRAIDVVAGLRDRDIDVTLLVVGRGPEQKELEAHARRLGVAHRVRFLGFRSGADLRDALWAADVQLCTSDFENLSLALIEGMAAGVPIAALPTGGTVGLLNAIDPTLLAHSATADALVSTVAELLTDQERRQEAAARSRTYVVKHHDWERVVDQLELIIQALAVRRG